MRAGRLRHRVTLYRNAGAAQRLASGERTEVPEVLVRDLPAEVLQLSGRELERARALVADVTHQVTIRYRAEVTSRCWFVWNGQRLDIEAAIDQDGRRREMVCTCVGRGP